MARLTFGGTIRDTVARRIRLIGHNVDDYGSATLTAWSARTGGTQYTDLLVAGVASTTVPVGTDGQIPEFQGPDGVTTLWLSADAGGARVKMLAAEGFGDVDIAVAGRIGDTASATRVALSATFARKRERDPRDFGLTGGADDSAALQACIDDAGPGGTVVLPDDLTIRYRTALVLPTGSQGIELRGSGPKGSILQSDMDVACLTGLGGEGLSIRNLGIKNTATTRATYDVDLTNPTKPVLEDVEVECVGMPTGGGGGVRFRKDGGLAGNAFMPQLARVWIRQGSLVADGVTDGHFVDGFVWAADAAAAAVHLENISDGWTFATVDVVPSDSGGSGYLIENTNHIKFVGGYIDGGVVGNLTGYGIRAVDSGRLFIAGTNFYALGRSGIRLENTHGCVVSTAGFYRNNKQNGAHPDIDLYGSSHNTFIGTSHGQPDSHTSKGAIYREDSASVQNLFDAAVYDITLGSQYASPVAVANANTLGRRNRPGSLWPRPAGVSEQIIPPASLVGFPNETTWGAANTAVFHRFTVTEGGVYRYGNVRIGVSSGNMQIAVVKLSGNGYADYTRVMNSGVVACVAGNKTLDLGATYLEPGEYAIALWIDNVTATTPRLANSTMQAARLAETVAGLSGGIPASATGALSWGANGQWVGGLTLSQTTT